VKTAAPSRPKRRRAYSPRLPADARREQLMDAALDIIVRDGYGAVSVESIVREVDVTRPVFYNVFAGLEELLSALLDRQEQRALAQLASTIALPTSGDDLGGFLDRTVRALIAMVADDPRTWMPILRAAVDTPDAVRRRIDRDREAVRLRFRDFASFAGDERLDPDVMSHALVALGEYFGKLTLADPAAVDPVKVAATLAAFVS
jgi:AcrR family transcriptional regulator